MSGKYCSPSSIGNKRPSLLPSQRIVTPGKFSALKGLASTSSSPSYIQNVIQPTSPEIPISTSPRRTAENTRSNSPTVTPFQLLNPEKKLKNPTLVPNLERRKKYEDIANASSTTQVAPKKTFLQSRKPKKKSPTNTSSTAATMNITSSPSMKGKQVSWDENLVDTTTTTSQESTNYETLEEILIERMKHMVRLEAEAEVSKKVYASATLQLRAKQRENVAIAKQIINTVKSARSSMETLQKIKT